MANRNGKLNEENKTTDPNPTSGSGDTGAGSNTNGSSKPDGTSGTGGTSTTSHSGAVNAATRVATAYPLGAPTTDERILEVLETNESTTTKLGTVSLTEAQPGVMVLDYVPTFGYSNDINSALNRASNSVFNAIRSQISGNRPYQPADHMIYRGCVDSARELYYSVTRIYGIIGRYMATNLYTPRAILTAMGYDAEDIISNAADIFQWLHTQNEALKPFPTVPIGSISGRRIAYASAIFTDGDIESSQMYIPNQRAFYSYEVVDKVKGLTLRMLPDKAKWADITSLWDTLIRALANSTDVYIIAADIRRAFPDSYVWELPVIDNQYAVPIGKSDFALDSIMNTDIFSVGGVNNAAFINSLRIVDDITGDTGTLKCTPKMNIPNVYGEADQSGIGYLPVKIQHVNAAHTELDTDQVLRATQNKVVHNPKITWNFHEEGYGYDLVDELLSFGFEIFTGVKIATLNPATVSGVSVESVASGLIYANGEVG